MEPNTYLPKEDSEKLFWLNNFIEKLHEYANSLGFSSSDTIVIEQDIQKFRSLLRIKIEYHHGQSLYGLRGPVNTHLFPSSRSEAAAITPKPDVPGWLFKRLSKTVREIKEHPAYSETIGLELGLVRANKDQIGAPDFTNVQSSIQVNTQRTIDNSDH